MIRNDFYMDLTDDFDEKWCDFSRSLDTANLSLPAHELINESIKKVFSLSDFVARSCIRNPTLFLDLVKTNDLFTSYPLDGYENRLKGVLTETADEKNLADKLRSFRRREMVRVAWRDLAGWADLTETFSHLTIFADCCIRAAADFLHSCQCDKYGTPLSRDGKPQKLVILGMGKLGSRELNFSSDIDLIFAYPEKGSTRGGDRSITNEEFFLDLSRRLIKLLGASTAEGNLFRVDMRLRPYGENGPLVLCFDAMEEYYEIQGREWERYAWLRARVVTGDKADGDTLLKRMAPFVYRRYLDYTVFESLREMKHKIAIEVKRKDMAENIKLGLGGIREIEFFCQIFQILRGGIDTDLRGHDTLSLLNLLVGKKYITQKEGESLSKSYGFLRNTEHRLQEFKDLQTHTLPSDSLDRLRLAVSMGFDDFEEFEQTLNLERSSVHEHFNQILASDDKIQSDVLGEDDLDSLWLDMMDPEEAKSLLTKIGYDEPEKILDLLNFLREAPETRALSSRGKKRIDLLMPRLLKEAGTSSQPDMVLNRIVDLIKTIEQRTNYIALMLENHVVLTHLITLAEKSPWIIKFLARHPVLLDELLDHRTLYEPPDRDQFKSELRARLKRISSDDLEYQIDSLCILKQINTLRVAAADVTEALYVMRVSDYLTEIAETILESVMDLAWDFMVKKHGSPVFAPAYQQCDKGFLIIGYGKVGGIELGYQSDLDLVFLHAGISGETHGGKQSIDTPYFFSRLGQRIVHLLTARTRAGVLYETDMRLRPSGSAGPLVSQIDSFFEYQMNESWMWEKQALVRARPLCGDTRLARRFEEIRKAVLAVKRDEKALRNEVFAMRKKMRAERLKSDRKFFDLKEDEGGIIDIEFIVQYLVLLKSYKYPALMDWTDNIRIIETLQKSKIIAVATADRLKEAYLTFRTATHRLNLQERPAKVPAEAYHELRSGVIDIWKSLFKVS